VVSSLALRVNIPTQSVGKANDVQVSLVMAEEVLKLRCPVCNAENTSGPACRRCKADLSLLWHLEQQRATHLIDCHFALQEDRLDDALEAIQQASSIRDGDDLSRLRACVHLLAENFDGAYSEYLIASGKSSTQ
jgi:hypothetical protein